MNSNGGREARKYRKQEGQEERKKKGKDMWKGEKDMNQIRKELKER